MFLRGHKTEGMITEGMITEDKKSTSLAWIPSSNGQRNYWPLSSKSSYLYALPWQLEAALESRKLSHLVKDVRQRGNNRGRKPGNDNGKGKVINMMWERGEYGKRKSRRSKEENWMNVSITFPSMPADDVSDEPLIIEVEVEGYLVRRVFVDQGAAVQVMFKHYFDRLSSSFKACLTPTQTELEGFSGEQLVPIGKVELQVTFESEGLCRRIVMKFIVVRVSSPYNIIQGRTGMKELRVVSSTIHAMMKFPTPRGVATLVARAAPMYECRCSEKKKPKQEEGVEEMELEEQKELEEEKVLINPAFPEQKVTVGT
ncbi:reverse transcriptase domain-containing protein [Tanacetum coccineum]